MSFIQISACISRQDRVRALQVEQDYLLLSLARAVEVGDEKEKHACSTRLQEIHMVLEYFAQGS